MYSPEKAPELLNDILFQVCVKMGTLVNKTASISTTLCSNVTAVMASISTVMATTVSVRFSSPPQHIITALPLSFQQFQARGGGGPARDIHPDRGGHPAARGGRGGETQ